MSTNDRIYAQLPWFLTGICTSIVMSACTLPPAAELGTSQAAQDQSVTVDIDASIVVFADAENTVADMAVNPTDINPSPIESDQGVVAMPCLDSDHDGDGFGTDSRCHRLDCDDDNPSIHPESSEACNGVDDDCDGTVDEDIPMVTCGYGACERTLSVCVDGGFTPCMPGEPQIEICNGSDDDCDGQIDELIEPVTCGQGVCQSTATCVEGIFESCQPLEGEAERCDGQDNDCDGTIDEGFGAQIQHVPYTELSVILDGCSGEGWAGVSNADCDAAMHRYCVNQGCFRSGFGPVEHSNGIGHVTCLSNVSMIQSDFSTLSSHHEVCASDGERRGRHCNAAISRLCRHEGYVSGYGPIEYSGEEVVVACVAAPAHHHEVDYSLLSTFHEPCDGMRDRDGPNCNAAIKRYCRSIGYASGFGPNENSRDIAVVTCLP